MFKYNLFISVAPTKNVWSTNINAYGKKCVILTQWNSF